jgi:hypothetical protein
MRDHTKERANEQRRTELLAYEFWRARGCPEGSPEEDWFLAEEQLTHQKFVMAEAA